MGALIPGKKINLHLGDFDIIHSDENDCWNCQECIEKLQETRSSIRYSSKNTSLFTLKVLDKKNTNACGLTLISFNLFFQNFSNSERRKFTKIVPKYFQHRRKKKKQFYTEEKQLNKSREKKKINNMGKTVTLCKKIQPLGEAPVYHFSKVFTSQSRFASINDQLMVISLATLGYPLCRLRKGVAKKKKGLVGTSRTAERARE